MKYDGSANKTNGVQRALALWRGSGLAGSPAEILSRFLIALENEL